MTPDDLGTNDHVFVDPWLRAHREQTFMLQTDIARAMFIDASIVSLWEKGDRPVPHERLNALAAALAMSTEELLTHARIGAPRVKPTFDVAAVPPPTAPRVRAPTTIGKSEVRLLWCESGHGSGVPRRHHHGPAPSWAPGFMTLDADPAPYRRLVDPPTPRLRQRATTLASAPAAWNEASPAAGPAGPLPIPPALGNCTLCGVRRPISGPDKAEHEVSNAHHLQAIEDVQMREDAQARRILQERAHLHRGHLAMGIECACGEEE